MWFKGLMRGVVGFAALMAVVNVTVYQAFGQCGGAGCCVHGKPLFAPVYEWRQSPLEGDEGRYYLWRDNFQIGGWDAAEEYYRPIQADGQWGTMSFAIPAGWPALPGYARKAKAAECPCEYCDCETCCCAYSQAGAMVEKWRTHGVDAKRRNGSDHCDYSINGNSVSKREALEQLKLEDDSHKMWLVLIGPEPSRKKVVDDLSTNPVLDSLKNRVRVWSVPADHFSLMDRSTNQPMFDNTGNPSVYLMSPNGEVLSYQTSYTDAEDLRKADPELKKTPNKTPDKAPDSTISNNHFATWILALGAGVAVLILSRKEK